MKRTINVCLISPPQINSLDDRIDPPLGLLYVAASIRDMGIEVRVADLASQPYAQWEKLIGKADVYGIEIYTCNYSISKQIKKVCKKLNPKSNIVVGGAHPTALPKQTLKDFDIVIKGEADLSIKECLKDIMERKQKAVYDFNIPQDLDELSFPGSDTWEHKKKYGIRRIVRVYSEFYNIAGQGEGGLVTETDSYDLEELMEIREDLKGFLTKRRWRGDIQEYFKRIKWR